jgi:hypothetical protein
MTTHNSPLVIALFAVGLCTSLFESCDLSSAYITYRHDAYGASDEESLRAVLSGTESDALRRYLSDGRVLKLNSGSRVRIIGNAMFTPQGIVPTQSHAVNDWRKLDLFKVQIMEGAHTGSQVWVLEADVQIGNAPPL